jgi:hypothetical protein
MCEIASMIDTYRSSASVASSSFLENVVRKLNNSEGGLKTGALKCRLSLIMLVSGRRCSDEDGDKPV